MSSIAIKSGSRSARRSALRVVSGAFDTARTAGTTDADSSTARVEARWTPVVIRLAVAADETPLRRLAQLDSARPLAGETLLAEQGGAIVAAVSMTDSRAIADPFAPTADALALLRLRARQLVSPQPTAA